MDNLDPPPADNPDPTPTPEPTPAALPEFSWKDRVGGDLSKAPSLGKFEDTPEGLAEMGKSYVNLEKLLSNEKVPLPKGPDDAEGIAQFNKAIGVPETPEGYTLPDPVVPDAMKDSFNREGFQQVVHKHKLTPEQANGLWKDYTEMSSNVYANSMKEFESKLDSNINELRRSWGDAYDGNVELGDMVINKFSDNKDMSDFLTASLSKDPAGMKFLQKIGTQFAENKVGDFQYKRFAMTAEEAGNEVTKIKADPNHPYVSDKATDSDHQAAVDHVNRLIAISMGKQPIGR